MAYPGGKSGAGVFQRLINEMPPHDVYVGACLGHDGVLRNKRPARRNIGIEIDRQTLEDHWRNHQIPNLELYNCCAIEWLRHAFGLDRWPAAQVAESCVCRGEYSAAELCGADVGGRGVAKSVPGAVAKSRGPVPGRHHRPPESAAVDRPTHNHAAAAAAESRVEVLAAQFCDAADRRDLVPSRISAAAPAGVLVYIDPPYPRESRASKEPLYRFEMTTEQHVSLLDVAVRLPCLVMISTYPNALYAERLAKWRAVEYWAPTRAGKMARELVYCNFPEPAELHDYNWLGRNKRERERIRRRRRNWVGGLERMTPHERRAVLEAIYESNAQ